MKKLKSAIPECYEGDTALPIFSHISSKRKRLFTVKDVVSCILHPSHNANFFCQKVPTHIHSNVSFLVDTDQLDDPGDIDSDDMGVWKNNRVDSTYVIVQTNSREVADVDICKKSTKRGPGCFLMKRVYRIHGTDSSLKKITSTVYGMYNNVLHLYLLTLYGTVIIFLLLRSQRKAASSSINSV